MAIASAIVSIDTVNDSQPEKVPDKLCSPSVAMLKVEVVGNGVTPDCAHHSHIPGLSHIFANKPFEH